MAGAGARVVVVTPHVDTTFHNNDLHSDCYYYYYYYNCYIVVVVVQCCYSVGILLHGTLMPCGDVLQVVVVLTDGVLWAALMKMALQQRVEVELMWGVVGGWAKALVMGLVEMMD